MNLRLPALFCSLFACLVFAPFIHASDDPPGFVIKNEIIPSPSAAGSTAPQLVNAPDGSVYLSWLEPAPANRTALRFARFDAATHTWSPARTIGESLTPITAFAFTPRLAVASPQHLAALWHPAPGIATLSTTTDGGANWSPPVVLNRPSHHAANAAVQPLSDGQFLAVWIEPDAKTGVLLARTSAPKSEPVIVEPAVSPACAPAIVTFPDGSALVAYRALAIDGISDIRTARFHDGLWDAPATLNVDEWKPDTPPRNSPALVARGVHAAAAWFTATEGARVNVSASDNAGGQWLLANRVDDITPLGRPGLVLFDDGSQLVSWVESDKGNQVILLRRISARGSLNVPVQIGRTVNDATPGIARVKDGDSAPAQVLVAFMEPGSPPSGLSTLNTQPSTLSTRLITLPPAAQLTEADPCDCDPRPEDMRGYPIKGRIVSIDAAHGTLQLEHDAILGVMKAGTTTVQVGPDVLRSAQAGRTVLARMERTGPDWTLFNMRVLEIVAP